MINGNFDIWQRGQQFVIDNYNSGYTADRWFTSHGNTKGNPIPQYIISRVNCDANEFASKYALKLKMQKKGGRSSYINISQFVEDTSAFRNKKVTLSFWAKANMVANLENICCYAKNRGQLFYNVESYRLDNTWKKITRTVNFQEWDDYYVEAECLMVCFIQNGETDALEIDIAQVQLEIGEVATEFEYRPIGLELMLCQRYYECFNSSDVAWIKCRGSKLYGQLLTTQRFRYRRKRTLPSVRFTGSYSCGAYNDYGQSWFFSDGILSPYWLTDSGCHLRITSASYTFLPEDYLLCIAQDNNKPFRIEVDAEL